MQNEIKNSGASLSSNSSGASVASSSAFVATPSGPTACEIANRCGLTLSFAGLKQISTPELLETEAPADALL